MSSIGSCVSFERAVHCRMLPELVIAIFKSCPQQKRRESDGPSNTPRCYTSGSAEIKVGLVNGNPVDVTIVDARGSLCRLAGLVWTTGTA